MYNGKEIADDYGLNWHYYGFRSYDAAIGRFPSIDPIADNFAFVSGYNYAENSPIKHVDLWGLQKAIFDINARSNSTFMSSYYINRQTSGGKKFDKALKQSNVITIYAILTRGVDGFTAGPFKSFEEFTDKRATSYSLYYSTEDNWKEYENYFEEGKEVLVIGAYCNDDCTQKGQREVAHTINHEEVSHGINKIEGVEKAENDEHKDYNDRKSKTSPAIEDIKSNPRYKNSEAKKQLDEIDKIITNENS